MKKMNSELTADEKVERMLAYLKAMAMGIARKKSALTLDVVRGSTVRVAIVPHESDGRHLIGRGGKVFLAMKTLCNAYANILSRATGAAATRDSWFVLETVQVPPAKDVTLWVKETIVPGEMKDIQQVADYVAMLARPTMGNIPLAASASRNGDFTVLRSVARAPSHELEEAMAILTSAHGIACGGIVRLEWGPAQ